MPVPPFAKYDTPPTLWSIYGSDLVAHYRADRGVTVDGSNRVSNVLDLTGNGHDLTQTVAGSRPDYLATGGPKDGPRISSGTYGTAFLNVGGTPVPQATGAWTVLMTISAATLVATRVLSSTAVAPPAGCVQGAFRVVNATGAIDFQQLGLAAPSAITVASPNVAPVPTWCAAVVTMAADGTRSFGVLGEGISAFTTTGPHAGNIGLNLAEGYVCARFGGTYYLNVEFAELAWVKRTSTSVDLAKVRQYMRTNGFMT